MNAKKEKKKKYPYVYFLLTNRTRRKYDNMIQVELFLCRRSSPACMRKKVSKDGMRRWVASLVRDV